MSKVAGAVTDEPVRGSIPGIGYLSLAGVERLRATMDGRVPLSPVQRLTGLRFTQVGFGSCTAALPASPWFQTQVGYFMSGVTALAADFALGGAIASALPPWSFPVTSDINFTFLRPLLMDAEKIIARGRLIDAGRNQGTAEALIEDGSGKLLAHATTRCFIRTIEPQEAAFQPEPDVVYDTPDPVDRPLPPDVVGSADLAGISGIDIMRAIGDGSLPSPYQRLTGFALEAQEPGRITTEHPASAWFQSPAGTIYGGVLCLICDGLTTGAATTILEPGTATATLDLKIHFLRPALADGGVLRGEGRIVHGGKGLIVAHGELSNAEGKPVVIASGSFMRRQIRDWVPVRASG